MEDTLHHKQLRQRLLNQLHTKGINDVAVLEAMNKVPRHLFLSADTDINLSYEDRALPIGDEQTISQPFTVAYQTSLLNIQSRDKVLEIGTGTGYQAAVLFEMGADVYTIERRRTLSEIARKRLGELGYSAIATFYGDGHEGLEDFGPYDKILLTAATNEVPQKLFQQLKRGGIMVLPTTDKMLRVLKTTRDEMEIEYLDRFLFVPMLPGICE